MADIAASVLAKLKNKSIQSGRSNQLCLQLFCQEEFSVKALNSRPSTPNAGSQTEAEFLSSPEGIQFRTTAYGAAKAALTGDIDELKNHLVNPSDATKFTNSFSDYQVDLIKFQCQFNLDAIKSDHEMVTSYEFTPAGKETNMYVSMELKKVNDEWLVDWLGVEQ